MAPRTVKEWRGASPDAKIPPRVKARVHDRAKGICHLCSLPIKVGETWDADHVAALVNGGEHRESNLAPAHKHCHLAKTAKDVKEKAKVAAVRKRHLGIVENGPKLAGQPFRKTRKSADREARAAAKLPLTGMPSLARRFAATRPETREGE